MFSLIVVVIAVLLTAGIAVATIYYGGTNISTSGNRALAEQLVNAGEHITSAGALYQNDHAGSLPSTPSDGLAPYYLSSLPLPPQAVYATGVGTASAADWQYLSGTANVILPKLSTAACNTVNALYGIQNIPATLDSKFLIQCYGTKEPYTFFFDPPGGNMKEAAQLAAASATDPYFQNVVLLMHMDGTNNNTIFTDIKGHATSSTNAYITTAYSEFGGASGQFNDNAEVSVDNSSSDFTFGAGDFTVEAWIRPVSTAGYQPVFTTAEPVDTQGIWFGVKDGQILVDTGYGSGAWVTRVVSGNIPAGQWTHIAVTRSGTALRTFVNGILTNTSTDSTNLTANPQAWVGGRVTYGQEKFYGDIDDLRVTKGVARYTASFTPPTTAFPDN